MISVIVYTRNDESTIQWCLESLVDQQCKGDHEVVVIDDGSTDRTPEVIRARFPQFRYIRNPHPLGWLVSLRDHLASLRGDVLAFLGAHCEASTGWLATIEKEMAGGRQVITGIGHMGEWRLLDRFVALAIQSYWTDREKVESIWDDNFSIKKELLERVLPETDRSLSDGAGAGLLSRQLKERRVPIISRPGVVIDHVGNNLPRILGLWYAELSQNAVAMRIADPGMPGAGLLSIWPVAAGAITAGRVFQSAMAMFCNRKAFQIPLPEVFFHLGLLIALSPVYFAGLCRQMILMDKAEP